MLVFIFHFLYPLEKKYFRFDDFTVTGQLVGRMGGGVTQKKCAQLWRLPLYISKYQDCELHTSGSYHCT